MAVPQGSQLKVVMFWCCVGGGDSVHSCKVVWSCNSRFLAKPLTPTVLGFQLANTWPKKTARHVYAMVRNGKER